MTNPQLLADLKAARELIAAPGGWTQQKYARDVAGRSIDPMSPYAVCFCAEGAPLSFLDMNIPDEVSRWDAVCGALLEEQPEIGNTPQWQDQYDRTQADVVALYDRAIASEQERMAP